MTAFETKPAAFFSKLCGFTNVKSFQNRIRAGDYPFMFKSAGSWVGTIEGYNTWVIREPSRQRQVEEFAAKTARRNHAA